MGWMQAQEAQLLMWQELSTANNSPHHETFQHFTSTIFYILQWKSLLFISLFMNPVITQQGLYITSTRNKWLPNTLSQEHQAINRGWFHTKTSRDKQQWLQHQLIPHTATLFPHRSTIPASLWNSTGAASTRIQTIYNTIMVHSLDRVPELQGGNFQLTSCSCCLLEERSVKSSKLKPSSSDQEFKPETVMVKASKLHTIPVFCVFPSLQVPQSANNHMKPEN